MRQTTLFAVALILGGTSLFAADPQLLNMAPPNAQAFVGINVEQAKTSQFGQFVLAHLPASGEFETFINTTGFDPRRDLREILITASAPTNADLSTMSGINGLFLAKGTFNIPQILIAAGKDAHVVVSTYSGVQMLTIEGHQALGLIDASTAVAGDVASVKGALDRRNGTNIIDPATMALINELSTTEDAWTVSTSNLGKLVPSGGGTGPAAILSSIQQTSGGVKFGSNVQVDVQAVATDEKNAGALGDVIKMLAQMVSMHGGANAGASDVANLLKNLVVTTDGSTLKVSLSVPEAQLESLFQMAESQKGVAHI